MKNNNGNNLVERMTGHPGRLRLGVILSALLMSGCEAPLNLTGVEQELDKSVRRTDQILALASTDRVQVAVGNDGLVLSRPGPAAHWQRQVLAGHPNLIDVAACPDGSLMALSFERQLWVAPADAGQWRRIDLPTAETLLDAECAPDGSYWAVGSFSTLLSSRDGGASWDEFSLDEDAMLTAIRFVDARVGYAVGEFGLVARTDDGGRQWQSLAYIPGDFYPQAAHFRTAEQGWVVGLDGMILHTADGGASWQTEPTPVVAPLYGLTETAEGLFALGENGTLLRRGDARWQQIELPPMPVWLRAGVSQGAGELLIAGGAGTLISQPIR